MPNTVRIATQVTGVGKASSELDKLKDRFEKLQKQGAKGFAIGAGAAITAKGLGLLDAAASGVVGTLTGMTERAIADEESVARLGASLRANVPAWNGSTVAIERRIKAAQRLGFADEDLRASLALLVGATHDVGKAQEIQATAMDLARFKNISLQDATEALTRVEAGSYRILKSLGIVLKDGATQTDALAAVQKVAARQAEDYANTTRGKTVAATIALDEAMEHLGKVGIPVVVEAANVLTGALDRAGIPLERLQEAATRGSQGAQIQLRQLQNVADELGISLEQAWQASNDAGTMAVDVIRQNMREMADEAGRGAAATQVAASRVGTSTASMDRSLKGFASVGKSTARSVTKSISDIADAFDKEWNDLAGAADQAAEDIFGPLERRAALAANKLAQGKDLGIIARPSRKGETTAERADEIAQARADLLGLQKDFFKLTADMAGRGELTAKEISKLNTGLKDELKTASNEETVSILALIALLDRLRQAGRGVFGKPGNVNRNQSGSGPLMGGRASGGPVRKGVPVLVGEDHAEVFIPPSDGTIDPRAPQPVSGGGLGTPWSMPATNDAAAQWLPVIAGQLARLTAQEPNAARPQTARGDLARQAALMPGGRL